MSTFDIDGFGSFCLPEGKDYATCMINFTKGTSPLYPRYVPCSFSFFFDCTGILWDDEVPIPVSEPCTPDCPQAAWTKENGTFHGYVNGVIVDVSYEYYWRKGCGYQDIQVTDFVYSLDYGSPVGKDAIFAKIIRDIMYKNEMDFDPKASQILDPFVLCDATWRVTMGSCFSERYFHLSTWPFQPLLNAIALDDSTGGSGTSSTGFELGSLITSHLELYPLTPLKLLVAKHKCLMLIAVHSKWKFAEIQMV
jgi:hypothetical protein